MMLRATVTDTDPREPARVWVTIPQKYGNKPVRVFTRVQVSKGDHVYVTNTSVTRVPQWVVFDQQTEVGAWGNPYPHTHPIGQVDGLVDWVKEYEAWAKDHAARLDAADKRIAEGKAEVDAARKDLTQAQTDIAEAVRKATLEQARLDQAEANLDQMGRNLTAAGGRISANETALTSAQNRLTSAETTVQKTSTDLTALQGTVGDVQSKVIASEQKATEALAKAGAAQVSADGKTTITRALEPRTTQPGSAIGDTHFTMSSMGGGGVVTRQQRWDGSTWQDETVGHQVLASLDLGKATVGELDGGRISARSLSSDQFTVGVSGNLIVDPNFNDATVSKWRLGDRWQWVTEGTERCFRAIADGTDANMSLNGGVSREPSIPVTAGTTYALELDASGHLWAYLRVRYANGAVETPGTSIQYSTGTTARRRVAFVVKPDDYTHGNAAGTKPVAVTIYVRQPSNAPQGSVTALYSARFAPRTGSVLIEDGAVTGDKVEASTVSGAIGQFLKVEAQSGTFTDSLTGRNARLLGETVAESINITGKLRGRDAILSGTVDVGQLNVTGAMSAKIISTATLQARQGFFTDGLTAQDATLLGTTVAEKLVVTDAFSARVVNAMTAQTKNLVVTGDAILNQATVVKSLVTPELITQKADVGALAANMISTGALIAQDSTGSVQINSGGITAQDAAPSGTFTRQVKLTPAGLTGGTRTTQTVRIDGVNNFITGTFATAEKEQRVEIKSGGSTASADFYGSGNTVDHLGVWHSADRGDATASRIISQNSLGWIRENPGVVLWPFRGDFGFAGRWSRNTDTVKMFSLVNYSGIPGGAWVDLTFTYPTPFPTQYSERIPVMSVESRSGAECTINTRTNNADSISFRVVNKSNNPTDVLYVRGFTFNFNTVTYSTTY